MLTNYFLTLLLLIFGVYLFNVLIMGCQIERITDLGVSDFLTIVNITVVYIVLIFASNWISGEIARGIYDSLSNYGDIHIFDITRGDKNEQDLLRRKDDNAKKKIVVRTILNILINICCGVFATLFTSIFTK